MESRDICHNPPPPPELLEDCDSLVPDKVGETVFSKQWLFQALLNIMEAVEKEKENVEPLASDSVALNNGSRDRILELDPEVEEKICTLWDMSSDIDVAHFLLENGAVDIFLDAIQKTIAPRLVETLVGILGNMAFFNDICDSITKTPKFIELTVQLIGSSDAPAIIQLVRLIHVCIVNDTSGLLWIETISKDSQFIESLKFILRNSLNGDLLKGSLQLLYCILDKYQQQNLDCERNELVVAVTEAGKQLTSLNDLKGLDEFWHTLYFLLQEDDGTIKMDENSSVPAIFHHYIFKQKDNDTGLPKLESITAVAAAVSVFHFIMANGKEPKCQELISNHVFLQNIEEMLGAVTRAIDRIKSSNNKTEDVGSDVSEPISNPVQDDEEQSSETAADLAHLYILHSELKDLCDAIFSCSVNST